MWKKFEFNVSKSVMWFYQFSLHLEYTTVHILIFF